MARGSFIIWGMPHPDALKWNKRYRDQNRYSGSLRARPLLLENVNFLPATGLALDVAMGLGGNAGFLLARGLRVVGVDISWVAVRQAKASLPGLQAVIADLPSFYIPPGIFDVIMNFYFLQRELIEVYRQALRPGGVLFFETLTRDMLALDPEIDPRFLLEPGELLGWYSDWEVQVYHEGWIPSRGGKKHPAASLVARKPA